MIFEPKGDQLEGIQHIVRNSFWGLFWDPGRGKTVTVLEAYQILRDEGFVSNMLVTSTKNVVESVWPEEIEKWDDLDITYSMLTGGAARREQGMDMDADVYLINNENLFWLYETYGQNPGFDMLVVDESSKFRNGKVRRKSRKTRSAFTALYKMLGSFSRRGILTGTPIPRGYLNLYPQMYIVDRGASLGDTLTTYRNRYFISYGFKNKNYALRPDAEDLIHEAIADRIHRSERDMKVSCEFFDIEVKLDGEARQLYDELEREFIAEWEGKTILAQNAAIVTQKLRQAANGAVYYDRESNWTRIHDAKLEALKDLIEELQGQPLLVAYEFEHDYDRMIDHGIPITKYAGSAAAKAKLKRQWEAGELPVVGAHIDSLSHGLNFQYGGRNALYFGLTYNLDAYDQFYQRIWRQGQEHGVIVYHLVAKNTIDDVMRVVLKDRAVTQQALLAALGGRYKWLRGRSESQNQSSRQRRPSSKRSPSSRKSPPSRKAGGRRGR